MKRCWGELSFRGMKSFVWVLHIRVISLWSWPKNYHIPTAIDQFSNISFSEKLFSKIIFFQKFSKFFKKKSFEKNLEKIFRKNFMCGKKYFILHDFWKLFCRKWNLRKLINGSWDMIIFWPTSKAYNLYGQYSNEISNAFLR